MEIDIEKLGFTKEEVMERVVNRIADDVLLSKFSDEYGDEDFKETAFSESIRKRVNDKLDAAVDAVADKYTLPKMTEYLESFCIKETNQYGELKGKEFTFVEYLAHRAENWFAELVNSQGQTKGQDSYGWSKNNTRIGYMIHEHLDYQINDALKAAFKTMNEQVAGGIHEAMNIQMKKVLSGVSVSAKANIGSTR